jgi:hypothetical protein
LKEERGIVPKGNGIPVSNICLLYLLVVNGQRILRCELLNAPYAVIPNNAGMRPGNLLIPLNHDVIGGLSSNGGNGLIDRKGLARERTCKKFD